MDAVGQVPKPVLTREREAETNADKARKGSHPAFFEGRFVETSIYDYEQLGPGAVVAGPAIIEAPLTTIVVAPSYKGLVDSYRNVVITGIEEKNNGRRTGRPA